MGTPHKTRAITSICPDIIFVKGDLTSSFASQLCILPFSNTTTTPCLTARPSSRARTCPRRCSRTPWIVPLRHLRNTTLRRISAYIKKEFDKKYNPTWHCIVGRNFGSYVTHETRHFIYFYLGQVAILLFKSG